MNKFYNFGLKSEFATLVPNQTSKTILTKTNPVF